MPEPFCELEAETDSERAFVREVKEGDGVSLRAFLREHPELRERIDEPWFDFDAPAMVWVGGQRDRDKVRALLEHGADIDVGSQWAAGSYSALQHCVDGATEESLEFAEFLIEQGATIDFHSAAGLGRRDIIEEMLKADPAMIDARGPDGATALHLASSLEIAELLLDAGADPTMRCVDHGSTAAMWLLKSHPEISRRLVEAGSPVDLFMAAALGDIALIDRCLAEQPEAIGARIAGDEDWTNFTGGGDKYIWVLGLYRSPHKVAKMSGHEAAYTHLVERSPPITRLLVACECVDRGLADAALTGKPDLVKTLPANHQRMLADAAWEGEAESVQLMLDLGFDPHAPGDHDSTPVDRAAFHGYREIVELLLAADPEPPLTQRNEFGGTPLNTCLYGKIHGWVEGTDYPGTVRALLAAGATFSSNWFPHPDETLDAILREHSSSAVDPEATEESAPDKA